MSYTAEIRKALGRLGKNGTENPDAKHNTGRMIGDAFMWDEIARFAKGKSDDAWALLAREGVIPDKKTLEPGDHELAYSPNFTVIGKVSQPVRRFSGDELARLLAASKYKVPLSTAAEFIDRAKVPSTSMATLKVIERG